MIKKIFLNNHTFRDNECLLRLHYMNKVYFFISFRFAGAIKMLQSATFRVDGGF